MTRQLVPTECLWFRTYKHQYKSMRQMRNTIQNQSITMKQMQLYIWKQCSTYNAGKKYITVQHKQNSQPNGYTKEVHNVLWYIHKYTCWHILNVRLHIQVYIYVVMYGTKYNIQQWVCDATYAGIGNVKRRSHQHTFTFLPPWMSIWPFLTAFSSQCYSDHHVIWSLCESDSRG